MKSHPNRNIVVIGNHNTVNAGYQWWNMLGDVGGIIYSAVPSIPSLESVIDIKDSFMWKKKFNPKDFATHYYTDEFMLAHTMDALIFDSDTGGCKYGYITGTLRCKSPSLAVMLGIEDTTDVFAFIVAGEKVCAELKKFDLTVADKRRIITILEILSKRYHTDIKKAFYAAIIRDISAN